MKKEGRKMEDENPFFGKLVKKNASQDDLRCITMIFIDITS